MERKKDGLWSLLMLFTSLETTLLFCNLVFGIFLYKLPKVNSAILVRKGLRIIFFLLLLDQVIQTRLKLLFTPWHSEESFRLNMLVDP